MNVPVCMSVVMHSRGVAISARVPCSLLSPSTLHVNLADVPSSTVMDCGNVVNSGQGMGSSGTAHNNKSQTLRELHHTLCTSQCEALGDSRYTKTFVTDYFDCQNPHPPNSENTPYYMYFYHF